MFKKSKASPVTLSVSVAGSRASEKKEKNPKKRSKSEKDNDSKYLKCIGYVMTFGFILVSVFQATSAFSNVNTASIMYNNRIATKHEEKEKAQQMVADELDVTIDNEDDSIVSNTDDDSTYYMDENGNVVFIDENGNAIIYYIGIKCDNCGFFTADESICSECGSDLGKYVVYQVEAGDTLSKVSGEVGASVDSIAHFNELDNVNLIYTGESLRIPK